MASYVQDLFTVAMGGGSVRRYGDMAVVVLPGTALVTTRQEFQDAQRWARGRNTTGDESRDRQQMLAQLRTLVASSIGSHDTRGAMPQIARLAGIMRTEGMDLEAWRIPQAILDVLPPAPPVEPPAPIPLRGSRRRS